MLALKVLAIIVVCCLTSHVYGSFPFTWQNCYNGDKSQAPIQVTEIKAGPMPLKYPGELHLTIRANVTKIINAGAMLKFTFQKSLLGRLTEIPCVGGLGSCDVDLCSALNSSLGSTDSAIATLGHEVNQMFVSGGAILSCPFQPLNLNIVDFTLHMPDLSTSALSYFAKGDYDVKLNAYDINSKQQLGCVQFQGSLVGAHAQPHFLFGGR